MAKKKSPASSSSTSKTSKAKVQEKPPFPYALIVLPITLALLVALVWGIALTLGGNDDPSDEPIINAPKVEPIKSGPRPTGKPDDHRPVLATQARDLLEQARELSRRPNINQMLSDIAKHKYDDLPDSYKKKFYFADKIKEDEDLVAAAYVTTLQLAQVINSGIPASQKLDLLADDAWTYVYVDLAAGNAFVPLSLFLGGDAAFSLEFVWVDGKWQFAPYSFIDGVSSADLAVKGATDAIPQTSP